MTLESNDKGEWQSQRTEMVEAQIRARGIGAERVLKAFLSVPRHLFVPTSMRNQAYEDHPLPIGAGQTISQPYIVALMTEALQLEERDSVLEVGTGSGYQTAILCELAGRVYTIERHPELASRAEHTLRHLGYENFEVRCGDGTMGWIEKAPFDAIIVTAGSPAVPEPLLNQLKPGGRMVIPVGSVVSQSLLKIVKDRQGRIDRMDLGGCVFVKLVGQFGWQE